MAIAGSSSPGGPGEVLGRPPCLAPNPWLLSDNPNLRSRRAPPLSRPPRQHGGHVRVRGAAWSPTPSVALQCILWTKSRVKGGGVSLPVGPGRKSKARSGEKGQRFLGGSEIPSHHFLSPEAKEDRGGSPQVSGVLVKASWATSQIFAAQTVGQTTGRAKSKPRVFGTTPRMCLRTSWSKCNNYNQLSVTDSPNLNLSWNTNLSVVRKSTLGTGDGAG